MSRNFLSALFAGIAAACIMLTVWLVVIGAIYGLATVVHPQPISTDPYRTENTTGGAVLVRQPFVGKAILRPLGGEK